MYHSWERKLGPGEEFGSPAKIKCMCVCAHLPCFSSGLQESLLTKQKGLLLPGSEEPNIWVWAKAK